MRNIKLQHALALVADQTPGNIRSAFWLNFFSKPAPFMHIPEKNAQRNNVPVGFASFKKIKRGYYKFETKIITLNPADTERGELTRKYRDFLEEQLREQPDNYLWSHRRWKAEYKEEYKKLWID